MRTIVSMSTVLCLCFCACGQRGDTPAPRDSLIIAPHPLVSLRGSGMIQDSSYIDGSRIPDSCEFIAVVDSHGLLRPIAQRVRAGEWIGVWPHPTGGDSLASLPSLRVPREWRYCALDSMEIGAPIHLRWLSGFKAFCGNDWAYVTDLTGTYPVDDQGISRAMGFAFSPALDSIEVRRDSTIVKEYEEVQQQLGLWSNDAEGESSMWFDLLGYFHRDGRIFGLGVTRGYENEWYVLFEVYAEGGKIILDVPGGGC
jgi:hypothetical protein